MPGRLRDNAQRPVLDRVYTDLPSKGGIAHAYGEHVHILQTPVMATLLARLCAPETCQPEINRLVVDLYRMLLVAVMDHVFPRRIVERETRMRRVTERGTYHGEVIDPDTRVITVDIARAGMLPSFAVFELLCDVLDSHHVRQDHIFMNRRADESGHVVGVDVSGSKIGGDQDRGIVLFPDPMGATGGSLSTAISIYKEKVLGRARAYVSLNLIVTPQFIRRLHADHPDVIVFAARLDRGMSAPHVLDARPGALWDEEDGLTDHDYIVPGAGGFGELLNNAEH
jgi:uracil phosphoribosyltransferase